MTSLSFGHAREVGLRAQGARLDRRPRLLLEAFDAALKPFELTPGGAVLFRCERAFEGRHRVVSPVAPDVRPDVEEHVVAVSDDVKEIGERLRIARCPGVESQRLLVALERCGVSTATHERAREHQLSPHILPVAPGV